MKAVVRDLIRVRGVRTSRLMPDSGGEVDEHCARVIDCDLEDHPPLPVRVRDIDLEATRLARTSLMRLMASAQTLGRHASRTNSSRVRPIADRPAGRSRPASS